MASRTKQLPRDELFLQSCLGSVARAYRNRLGVSQEEMAWRAGLHRTYLADIERGKRNVSFTRMVRLVRALGAPLTEFFGHLDELLRPAVATVPDEGASVTSARTSSRKSKLPRPSPRRLRR